MTQVKQILKHTPVKAQELFNEIILNPEEQSAVKLLAQKAKRRITDEELTEDELQEAFMQERSKRLGEKNLKEYSQKLNADPGNFPAFTAEQVYEQLKKTPGFEEDEWNMGINWNLCLYFTNDPRCSYDRKKGLYVYGPTGIGKTSVMRFFRHNQNKSFTIFSVREISENYARQGEDGIFRYKDLIKTAHPEINFGQRHLGICFDDLGEEVDKKHYGNENNVMASILSARYDRRHNLSGMTHITSNISADEVEVRYGKRVRSRFREMFNMVEFDEKSPDRRK